MPGQVAAVGDRARLAGRIAIVTGSSRGIGRRIAVVLAREGARVVAAARATRDGGADPLRALVEQIGAAGGEALAVSCDVASEDQVRSLVDAAVRRFGGVDLLVNNAAMRLSTKLLDTASSDMERIIRVNVLGPFLMWKYVLPVMIARGGGGVVNIVSTNSAQQPYFGMAPYRMTKAALTFLSNDLAQEVQADRVAVNALDPGPVVSEGTAAIRTQREQRYGVRIPYHAQDPVEVIDEPIVWLARQTAATFTGNVVRRIEFGTIWGKTA